MATFSLEITRATVVLGPGADLCILHTKLPAACFPFNYEETLSFHAAYNTGPAYIRAQFPDIEVEVISRR
jgi:hypothetical protein